MHAGRVCGVNMQPKRIKHSKVTPEHAAHLAALAGKIDREERDSIKAKGRSFFARHELVRNKILELKAARQAQGLSLAEVGERSGIGKANLSRLENDLSPNPTWDTIIRFAESVGRHIDVHVR
jgi:DNA-binding XRE family transcriptional regulator